MLLDPIFWYILSQQHSSVNFFVGHTCCNTNNAPSLNWHLCMTSLCSSLSLLTNMSENKNSLVVIFQSHKAGKCDNVDQLHVDRKLVDNFIRVFEPLHLSPIIFDLYSVSHINVVACLVSMPPISLSSKGTCTFTPLTLFNLHQSVLTCLHARYSHQLHSH